MIWNDRIRDLRKQHDMTLKDVAQRLQTTEATAQRYETSIKNIPYDVIEKYAKIFNVSPSYIMGWEEGKRIRTINGEIFTKKESVNENLTNNIKWDSTIKSDIPHEDKPQYYVDIQQHNSPERIPRHDADRLRSSDYLIDDLVSRLYEMTPRQRMKVVDAVLTLLDYPNLM